MLDFQGDYKNIHIMGRPALRVNLSEFHHVKVAALSSELTYLEVKTKLQYNAKIDMRTSNNFSAGFVNYCLLQCQV